MPVIPATQLATAAPAETSREVAARVAAARGLALQRQGCINAQLEGQMLDRHALAQPAALALLQRVGQQQAWSGRAYHRSLRLARTLADLAGHAQIEVADCAEAVQLRRGLDTPA